MLQKKRKDAEEGPGRAAPKGGTKLKTWRIPDCGTRFYRATTRTSPILFRIFKSPSDQRPGRIDDHRPSPRCPPGCNRFSSGQCTTLSSFFIGNTCHLPCPTLLGSYCGNFDASEAEFDNFLSNLLLVSF
ncbi:unnamed protein product [Heligmosomoides polygyrus]|uniref:Uncharacterized protein n=1 Tax=Heligmosomoides polygyrus TaxID=6339 RepID=A0A183FRP0_HELPZ|nr:unnamed protein product [Heligmosomoides polygyrus]